MTLIADLRSRADRASANPSFRTLVPGILLGLAANEIESLSARVAELEAAALAAGSTWVDGPTDTGVPEVAALDPTPISLIEARLAALEAAERPAAPLGVVDCVRCGEPIDSFPCSDPACPS